MAQQITIDIVAETARLKQGIDEAGGQINSLDGKLKTLGAAAATAASAFVLKQGVTFLQEGIEEAKEAEIVMKRANATFGEGSVALQKITEDAAKFGREIAVDNDVLVQLSVELGSRLPDSAKALSAELVNALFDVEAFTGGAITAQAASSRLGKAFADGKLKASELQKIFPGLSEAVYEQAEALSEAGKNQEALSLIIEASQAKYGDAAEKNVTATQKFETALADLKEQIGSRLLPFVNKLIDAAVKLIDKFTALPGPVQNLILGFVGVVAIGGPLLTFLASAKTALVTLGIVKGTTTVATGALTAATGAQTAATGLATIATNLLSVAMRALPILAIIGLIVLLVQNWDTVIDVVNKVWEKILEFGKWFVSFISETFGNVWNKVKDTWNDIFDKTREVATNVINWLKENWPKILAVLTGPFGLLVLFLSEFGDDLFRKFVEVGKNIVQGLWSGIQSMGAFIKSKVFDFFGNLIPNWAKGILGIKSPSTVFKEIGQNIVAGLSQGLTVPRVLPAPRLAIPRGQATVPPVNITINAGLGTDPYELGRQVSSALEKYGRVSSRVTVR